MRTLKHIGRLLKDLWGYSLAHKRYWMIPLAILLALAALLAIVHSSPLAPFMYPIF